MKRSNSSTRTGSRMAVAVLAAAALASAELPTAKSIAAEMGMGWNLGNTMEVPSDPTAWGNPLPTQRLIDSVKAAGFKTLRIPCAWRSHSEADSLTIKPAWMAQVKELVDYAIKDSLFVILNIHWDEGWLESNIDTTTAVRTKVNRRQGAYWRQIATTFKDYDRHLLFASANEPAMQDAYGAVFGADRVAVLNSYHQTFIDTVRATGGNNASRTLILQGPRTDIELIKQVWTSLPTDKIAGRLMAEAHFYPYQFSLMESDADWGKVFWYWGKNNLSTGADSERNTTWCGEAFVDSEFTILKRMFTDKDIPVILGEFGAMKRTTLSGDTLARHIQSRRSFYEYVTASAKAHGIIPIAWDAGNLGDKTMSVFDRRAYSVFDLGLLNAMRTGIGLPKLNGDTSFVKVATFSSSLRIMYSAKDSTRGQVDLGVAKPDFSVYDSILVRAYVKGSTNYDSAGVRKYGFLSLSLVTMSNNWAWKERNFGALTFDAWKTYGIKLSSTPTDTNALAPADPTKVDFFALQAYSNGYRGSYYIDWIAFRKKAGGYDTLYSYDLDVPNKFNDNVVGVSLVPTSSVAADLAWQTETTSKWSVSVAPRAVAASAGIRAVASNGVVRASWTASEADLAKVSLKDLQGRVLWAGSVATVEGANALTIPVRSSGVSILRVQQGEQASMVELVETSRGR